MSIMLYKYPGPGKGKHFLHKIHVDYIVIEPKDLDEYLDQGWERSPKKAKELYEKVVSGELFPEKTKNDNQVNADAQADKEVKDLGDFEMKTEVIEPEDKVESDNPESENDVEHLFDPEAKKVDLDSKPTFGQELEAETEARPEVTEDDFPLSENDYLSAYDQSDQEENDSKPVEEKEAPKKHGRKNKSKQ